MPMKKVFLLPVLSLAAQLLCGAELLENGSFEIPSEKKSNRNWRFYPAKGWEAYANPKDGNDCRVITEGAADGSRCIRLISKNKKAMVSMRSDKMPEVKPGDRVFAECMIRGKGKAYIRIYWYGADGKKLPKYYLDGLNATADWQVFKTNVKVPEGAASFVFSLEIIASLGEIDFDKAVCRVEPGTILDNGKIKAVFNPAIGGGIDSLTLKGIGMDFTQPNQIGNGGGMFNLILPANRNPGELRFAPAKAEVITPGQVIRMTQKIDSGDYAGIEAVRTFELLPDSSRIKVNVQIRNTGKKTVETSFRFQSFASAAPGSFTWPTPDWTRNLSKVRQSRPLR